MADYIDIFGGLGRTQIQRILLRPGKCRSTKYTTLWHTSYAKERKVNSNIFFMYYEEMQENLADTWRIPPKVVEENQHIAKF
jgi:hypothetical protein